MTGDIDTRLLNAYDPLVAAYHRHDLFQDHEAEISKAAILGLPDDADLTADQQNEAGRLYHAALALFRSRYPCLSMEASDEEHCFLVTMVTPPATRRFNAYLLTEVLGNPADLPFRIGCRMGEELPTVLLYRDATGLEAGEWVLLSLDPPVHRMAGDLEVTAEEMGKVTAWIDRNREVLISHWLHRVDSRTLLGSLRCPSTGP